MNFRMFFISFLIVMNYCSCSFAMEKKLPFKKVLTNINRCMKEDEPCTRTKNNVARYDKNELNTCRNNTMYTLLAGMAAVGLYCGIALYNNNTSAFLVTPF